MERWDFRRKRSYLVVGIAGLVVAFFLGGGIPLLIQTTAATTPPPTQSAESLEALSEIEAPVGDMAITVLDRDAYKPGDEPRDGKPYLVITSVVGKPDEVNKINFKDAPWLQHALDDHGKYNEGSRANVELGQYVENGRRVNFAQVVELNNEKQEAFFDFYDGVNTGSPFFEVTFPDGSVKTFDIRYQELP